MTGELKWYSFRWQTGVAMFLVMILPALVLFHSLRGRYERPVGEGPAGPAVAIQPFEHSWTMDKIVLVGLGDSITSGYGSTDGKGYFGLLLANDDVAYPDMTGRDLRAVLPNLEAVNYALSCSTSQQHLRDQLPRLQVFPDDVRGIIVLTTGGNDLIHDYGRSAPRDGAMYGCTFEQGREWGENFRDRLRQIIEGISSRFPGGCDIFLANIYDPTDGVGDIQDALPELPRWRDGLRIHGLFNEIIADACDRYDHVHLVDIHTHFLGHGIHCSNKRNKHHREDDPHYWYFENIEDPNDRGYDAIRRFFLLKMAEVLGTDRPPS